MRPHRARQTFVLLYLKLNKNRHCTRFLCCFQARWHCEQHIILAPSDWQWKQRWVSSGGAAASLPFPIPPVLPLAFLVVLVGVELLVLLAAAGAEASVGGVVPPDAASDASDAARAPSAVFGGMLGNVQKISMFNGLNSAQKNSCRCGDGIR